MSGPPQQDRNQDATCYVGNLDDRATDALVWELMLQAGPVTNVHLPKDRITSQHQGYGFAEFQTQRDADYACSIMNGIKLYGKPLRVNKASSDRKQIDIGANLFIGNLDPTCDERILWETFSTFGQLASLPKIARDPSTNASKCYGFVSFDSFEAADAAIEQLQGQFLLNRPVNVGYAIKKDGKGGERHGTAAERLLAAQARKNGALPQLPPQQMMMAPPPPPPMAPPGFGAAGQQPPPPPPPGFAGAAYQQQQQQQQPPPPPPGFGGQQQGQPPPPPPPMGFPQYSGPPPGINGFPPQHQQQQQQYMGGPPPPPPPGFMTGANMAPLGSR